MLPRLDEGTLFTYVNNILLAIAQFTKLGKGNFNLLLLNHFSMSLILALSSSIVVILFLLTLPYLRNNILLFLTYIGSVRVVSLSTCYAMA